MSSETTRDPSSRTRSSDRWWLRENWYRDVWLIIITIMVIWTSYQGYDNTRDATRLARDNRSVLMATCSATSAVIDAGRETLRSGAVIRPIAFQRALEKLGLPPQEVRIVQSEQAATAYGRRIAEAVERSTHTKGLAQSDGSLNCKALVKRAGGGK